MNHILLALASLVIGVILGKTTTYVSVKTDCVRLESFYIGSRVFKCVELKKEIPNANTLN